MPEATESGNLNDIADSSRAVIYIVTKKNVSGLGGSKMELWNASPQSCYHTGERL